jgi:uncharacterized protein YukE
MIPADVVGGDPASCSALGGALRRRAASLRDRRTALRHSATGLLGWTGPAADAFHARLQIQLSEVEQMAGRLDDIGAALQAYATDLAHAREQGALATDFAIRSGLVVDEDASVRLWPGPAAVEVAQRRLQAVPQAQHQVDGALAEARVAGDRLRRRTSSSLQALRSGAGRLATLDAPAR